MYEAQNPQTLEAILPRLVSDDRVRSALAERFGPRADDVRRRVEAGKQLEEEDRGAVIEEVEELLAQVGDVALTLPPEAEENEYYGEENMIVYVKVFKSFYWVDAPEFESGDAYFDSLEGAVRHAEDEYGHILGVNGDE